MTYKAEEWFRPLVRTLLAAGIPLAGLPGCTCPPDTDNIYLLNAPDETTAALIEQCRRPKDPQCLPLCMHVSGNRHGPFVHCELHEDKDGYLRVHVGIEDLCPGGRRPARVRFGGDKQRTSLAGALLARLAQLEAASVPAFETLACELRFHGAPPELVRSATAAAKDEVRHARVVHQLALRFGAEPGVARCPQERRMPSLAEMAVLNEREGCVRESYGALVAAHQGAVAGDRKVRHAMRRIAADELRHASLAREVRQWLMPRIGAGDRAAVERVRRTELSRLAGAPAVPASVGALLGLPNKRVAQTMLDALAREVA